MVPGDEVLAASLTFIGVVSPIVWLGASPVFIDVDKNTWTIDPDLVAEELNEREKEGRLPRAVITTDLYGQCADLDPIIALCSRWDIPVISDSAEAVGSTYRGRHAGTGSFAAVFSFNGNKIITTSGGGMLASDNPEVIEHARFLSTQARDPASHYEHSTMGYNYRMSNILAAIGRGQLNALKERVARKQAIFEAYRELLNDAPGITFMPEAETGTGNRWLTTLLIDPGKFGADRQAIQDALEQENIESRPLWKPMHLQPLFARCRKRGGRACKRLFERGLCLPSGTALTDSDLERIATVVKRCGKA
ncbi:MAG: DegT/DnrJ/EryC1/StrS family aminotransferase [Verrucomicrobiota bacterium]